ncbi:hypothetical protein L3Q82_004648 [Scortum barcoo]|uniref:Uncharacterized protein n=1 Tax=Scortum barcoo TaxID=214431 RepID=A0ACB8VH57_9TELE|nr:hypothetical protein L3Q82_004648 [Scortum barcoo]
MYNKISTAMWRWQVAVIKNMVPTLVRLCALEVVRDHCSSPCWLRWVPRELYGPLLQASFSSCRPLAVGELVQRWPERTLRAGGRRKSGQTAPSRLCIQALLLAVVRGLSDQRIAEEDECWLFQRQKIRKSPGPDGVSPSCLKVCTDHLTPILTQIFNRSLELCVKSPPASNAPPSSQSPRNPPSQD